MKDLRIEVHQSRDAIFALELEWARLSENCKGQRLFQSPAWCLHVLRVGRSFDESSFLAPLVITVRRGEKLIALWPLSVRKKNGLNIITSLADPFDQYSDMLCETNCDASTLLPSLVKALKGNVSADGILLRKVRLNSVLYQLIEHGASIIDENYQAPQVQFKEGQTFAEFQLGVKAKTRKNLRNYRNRLLKLGHLEHHVLEGHHIVDALRESFCARRQWLCDTGQSSAGFRDANFEALVISLADNNTNGLGLVAFALTLDNKMIAIQWGFIHQGCYHAYMSSRAPEFESYSVGRIHLQMVLEECHKLGVTSVDLMVPCVPYKKTWATSVDSVSDIVWPWSIGCYMRLGIFERYVRPQLKTMSTHLPVAVQKKLISRLNAPVSQHS